MVGDHVAGGSVSNFHTGGPHQRYLHQITSDIITSGLDWPSGRSHFQTGKFIWCPVQQLSQEKQNKQKTPNQPNQNTSEEVVMIQARDLEF